MLGQLLQLQNYQLCMLLSQSLCGIVELFLLLHLEHRVGLHLASKKRQILVILKYNLLFSCFIIFTFIIIITLLKTGECILITGTKSGTFHNAHTVGASLSPRSIITGTPSTTYTPIISSECKINFIQLLFDFTGINSFIFSSVAAENSFCIRWPRCFLKIIYFQVKC